MNDRHGLTAPRTPAKEQGIRPRAGELVAPADSKLAALVNRDDIAGLVDVSADAAAETEASPVFRVAARPFALELFGGKGRAGAHLEALVAGKVAMVPDIELSTFVNSSKEKLQGRWGRTPAMSLLRRDSLACLRW